MLFANKLKQLRQNLNRDWYAKQANIHISKEYQKVMNM